MSHRTLFVVAAVFLLSSAFLWASAPEPEYIPYGQSPQPLAPPQAVAFGANPTRAALVWNGKEYGAVFVVVNNGTLYFRRFFADGTPASAYVAVGSAYAYIPPSIAWNGTYYGVAWTSQVGSYYQANFALIKPDGTIRSGPTRVSFYGSSQTANSSCATIAASGAAYVGSTFAVVWYDSRNAGTGLDIYATILDGSTGAVNFHDSVISNASGDQQMPTGVWFAARQAYLIAYEGNQSGHFEIWDAFLGPLIGVAGTPALLETYGTSAMRKPCLAAGTLGCSLVWVDVRDGNYEIYFQLLDLTAWPVGSVLRLTNDSNFSDYPRIVWTGAEYGVFWQDNRSGVCEVWFQRVSSSGALTGGSLSNVQVTYSSGSQFPDAAFAQYGYLTSFDVYQGEAIPWGCNYVYNPPDMPREPRGVQRHEEHSDDRVAALHGSEHGHRLLRGLQERRPAGEHQRHVLCGRGPLGWDDILVLRPRGERGGLPERRVREHLLSLRQDEREPAPQAQQGQPERAAVVERDRPE